MTQTRLEPAQPHSLRIPACLTDVAPQTVQVGVLEIRFVETFKHRECKMPDAGFHVLSRNHF